MSRVLGIGNVLVDILARIPDEKYLTELKLPKGSMQLICRERYNSISEFLQKFSPKMSTGGSACNTLLALGNLRARPGLIGKVGSDDRADFFRNNCLRHGVSPILLRDKAPTGIASAFITPDGQRTFATYLGAAEKMKAHELQEEWFQGYDYFYIEGYLVQNHALICRAARLAKAQKMKICLDLASYNIVAAEKDFFKELLECVDIVFANEEEALAFTGCQNPKNALRELAEICPTAVVKLGEKGAMAISKGEYAQVQAAPVSCVADTTGAGDFFAAGFLLGEMQHRSLNYSLERGALLSARVIEVVGTNLPESAWETIRKEYFCI